MKPKMDRLTSSILEQEPFPLQMLVLHQSKCIFKVVPLSLRQVWAECKDKVPDVSDSIMKSFHHVIPNSNYQT